MDPRARPAYLRQSHKKFYTYYKWIVGWRAAALGSLRRLAVAAGRRNVVEGRYTGYLHEQGVCGDCLHWAFWGVTAG